MVTWVNGAYFESEVEVRRPHPVGAAPGASPTYCLVTIPPQEVFWIEEFSTVMSLRMVGVLGGAAMLGTVVLKTIPPVFLARSQPMAKWMPVLLFAVDPPTQLSTPVTSCTLTASTVKPDSVLLSSPPMWMPRKSPRFAPAVPVDG